MREGDKMANSASFQEYVERRRMEKVAAATAVTPVPPQFIAREERYILQVLHNDL